MWYLILLQEFDKKISGLAFTKWRRTNRKDTVIIKKMK